MNLDEQAAYLAYEAAVNIAKAEYDALEPQLSKMQHRAISLKRVIQAGSDLIGVPVEEQYMFKAKTPDPGMYVGHRSRGKA